MKISDIRRENKAAGFYFFDRGAMGFFKSKVDRRVYEGVGGVFFVTSERKEEEDPVRYTVRWFRLDTSQVGTEGKFMGYATLEDARNAAESLANTPR